MLLGMLWDILTLNMGYILLLAWDKPIINSLARVWGAIPNNIIKMLLVNKVIRLNHCFSVHNKSIGYDRLSKSFLRYYA